MTHGKWTLVVLAAVLACVAGFFALYERKDVEIDVPPSGKAATDHFYALERVMQRMGVATHALGYIPVEDESLAVLGVNPANLDRNDAENLLDFVSDGGTLVLPTGSPAVTERASFWKSVAEDTGLKTSGYGCLSIEGKPGEKAYSWCGPRMKMTPAVRVDGIGDATGDLLATVRYGDGKIILVPSLAPFVDRGLEDPIARRLVARLLNADDTRQSIALVYRVEGARIWSLLFTKGWAAMLAFAILLAAWAVSQASRLGPLRDAPRADRRALVEHVQAAGEFLYGRDRGRGLHARVCVGVLARARRLDPGTDGLDGELLYARLAERFDEAPADIARAFRPPADANAFRESIAILSRLRRHP